MKKDVFLVYQDKDKEPAHYENVEFEDRGDSLIVRHGPGAYTKFNWSAITFVTVEDAFEEVKNLDDN